MRASSRRFNRCPRHSARGCYWFNSAQFTFTSPSLPHPTVPDSELHGSEGGGVERRFNLRKAPSNFSCGCWEEAPASPPINPWQSRKSLRPHLTNTETHFQNIHSTKPCTADHGKYIANGLNPDCTRTKRTYPRGSRERGKDADMTVSVRCVIGWIFHMSDGGRRI